MSIFILAAAVNRRFLTGKHRNTPGKLPYCIGCAAWRHTSAARRVPGAVPVAALGLWYLGVGLKNFHADHWMSALANRPDCHRVMPVSVGFFYSQSAQHMHSVAYFARIQLLTILARFLLMPETYAYMTRRYTPSCRAYPSALRHGSALMGFDVHLLSERARNHQRPPRTL